MSYGSLGGQPFIIDPETIAYHFDIKASSQMTVGGKVVQVYGTRVSDMSVTGSFGSGGGMGGWEYQQQWLTQMTTQAQAQRGTFNAEGEFVGSAPIRFTYPPRNWDFQCLLLAYTEPSGSSLSVYLSNEVINPQWTLTLFIIESNGTLVPETNAALNAYITRLADGLGWGVERATSASFNASSPPVPTVQAGAPPT